MDKTKFVIRWYYKGDTKLHTTIWGYQSKASKKKAIQDFIAWDSDRERILLSCREK